ncbi:MAG: nucleoside kinase [Clostridiales bacterium]|jgi:uridine kinase|nr:nucleoside kinase [Clostridiales bacterium]MDR2713482.1 nucleoside kinase [Clostridiales bacterium]
MEDTISASYESMLSESAGWCRLLRIDSAADFNDLTEDQVRELILVDEARHEKKIMEISEVIAEGLPLARLVLIAGPSSAGKTTFAKRLAIQFRTLGIRTLSISMDDYFLDRRNTPLTPDGTMDFESIQAMDLPLFNRHLCQLLAGEEVMLPRYDFPKGQRSPIGHRCRLEENQVIIVEGIHALNPRLTAEIEPRRKQKIYISALIQLNLDDNTLISTTDYRLLRRITRDSQFRNHSPEQSLALWPAVRLGEMTNIFPFQEEAGFYFNSSLIYELAVLRSLVEGHLTALDPHSPVYQEARRLLRFIQYFQPIAAELVPANSICREFIGQSCFIYT